MTTEGFQPTLPARGATPRDATHLHQHHISTHAPRTGSDALRLALGNASVHFNPRSPHGERLEGMNKTAQNWKFQPTLPARGATLDYARCHPINPFQPTLPARGATACAFINKE